MDPAERATAVRALHSIRRGAYAIAPPEDADSRHRLLLRAVLRQTGGQCAASHLSAALFHDLPVPGEALDNVHITTTTASSRPGVRRRVHTHTTSQQAMAVTEIDGLPITDVATTVLDCMRVLPFVDAVALLDAALNRNLVFHDDIVRQCFEAGGMAGIATARRVVKMADAGAESVGETRTRLILVHAGFAVDTQVELHDSRGRMVARVDLKLRDAPVVVEFDGRAKYGLQGAPESAHWQEKLRNDKIGNLGFERVRVWWNRLADPASIVADVEAARKRALSRAGRESA